MFHHIIISTLSTLITISLLSILLAIEWSIICIHIRKVTRAKQKETIISARRRKRLRQLLIKIIFLILFTYTLRDDICFTVDIFAITGTRPGSKDRSAYYTLFPR